MPTSDLARMIAEADAVAAAILEKDKVAPGFAIAIVRNIIRQMSTDDALSVIGSRPKPKPDPASLIG